MMASILVKLVLGYHLFLNMDETIVAQLGKLQQYGFIPNPYDNSYFKISGDYGIQMTVVL